MPLSSLASAQPNQGPKLLVMDHPEKQVECISYFHGNGFKECRSTSWLAPWSPPAEEGQAKTNLSHSLLSLYFAKLLVTWCALQTVFRLHRLHHRHAVRSRATVGGRSSPVIKQIHAPAPPGL